MALVGHTLLGMALRHCSTGKQQEAQEVMMTKEPQVRAEAHSNTSDPIQAPKPAATAASSSAATP
jgi:hypothetical protein